MATREPLWTLKDLCEHVNISLFTAMRLAKTEPMPERLLISTVKTSFNKQGISKAMPEGLNKSKTSRYKRSELLAWYKKVSEQK